DADALRAHPWRSGPLAGDWRAVAADLRALVFGGAVPGWPSGVVCHHRRGDRALRDPVQLPPGDRGHHAAPCPTRGASAMNRVGGIIRAARDRLQPALFALGMKGYKRLMSVPTSPIRPLEQRPPWDTLLPIPRSLASDRRPQIVGHRGARGL